MVRFDLLDDGSRSCVLRVMPVGLPQAEAEPRFERHVADLRSRYYDRFVTQVRVEWVPQSAPREYYDLVTAVCSKCGRFVLTLPLRKLDDLARLGAFDISVCCLLNGCTLFRKKVWLVTCFACLGVCQPSIGRAC